MKMIKYKNLLNSFQMFTFKGSLIEAPNGYIEVDESELELIEYLNQNTAFEKVLDEKPEVTLEDGTKKSKKSKE